MFKRIDNQDMIEQKLSDGNIKRYVKGRLLGKGGFAKCYEVISLQTQKKYAAKIIQKASLEKSKAKQKLTSEIKIHKSLDHPYVVHFQHYFEDAQFVYILLQKCPNQTLNELLKRRKRLTDIQTKYYIRQLAVAIKYIHEQQIIHRDLKLGNLFLSEKLQIKIGDFGLATKLTHQGERKKTKCGTPNYIAPQILDDKKTHSFQVDVWSMGVIAYALIVGKPPFQTSDVKDTYNKIKTCSYSFPDSAGVSDLAKCFISKMLQLDPCKRSTINEVLSDPFLNEASIPTQLPMSSLACPPSFDFLKKYKDAQSSDNKNPGTYATQSLQKSQYQEQKKQIHSNVGSQQKNVITKKFVSRVNSIQKGLKSTNRVFSAANLLGNSTKSKTNTKNNKQKGLANKAVKIWITHFIQNPKFGMAYLLNSNAVGFRYNDYTVMISNAEITKFKYLEYDSTTRKLKQQNSKLYNASEINQHKNGEQKKLKILCHFSRDLMKTKTQLQSQMPNQTRIKIQQMKSRENSDSTMKCYVTKYHPSSKCVIFWLSTNAIQIMFEDSSELLINGCGVITYVNKYKDRTHFQQKDKEHQSEQIKKRMNLFYSITKNVLLKKCDDAENWEKGKVSKKEEKDNDNKNENFGLSRCNSNKLNNHLKTNNTQLTTRQLKTSSSITQLGEKIKKNDNRQFA